MDDIFIYSRSFLLVNRDQNQKLPDLKVSIRQNHKYTSNFPLAALSLMYRGLQTSISEISSAAQI